jgi:hypothetical protein
MLNLFTNIQMDQKYQILFIKFQILIQLNNKINKLTTLAIQLII